MALHARLLRPLLIRPSISILSTRAITTAPQLKSVVNLDNEVDLDSTPRRIFQNYLEPKLGVTGKWTLLIGFVATMVSKEYLIIHSETVLLVNNLAIICLVYNKFGSQIYNYLDAQIEEIKDGYYSQRRRDVKALEDKITLENRLEDKLSVREDLYELEKEAHALSREVEFRKRQDSVRKEFQNRLNYQLDLERAEKTLEQEYLVDWLIKQVIFSITPEQEKINIQQCISSIGRLAKPF